MSKQFILIKHLMHIHAGQTQDHFSVHVNIKGGVSNQNEFNQITRKCS